MAPTALSSIGGLVLAGGSGRRFGRPKASVTVRGRSLVERAVDSLTPHCIEVVIATRKGIALPTVQARVVYDDGEQSALRGLASGLNALNTDAVLVLACDLVVAPSLIERLLEGEDSSVVAADERSVQPLCARYARAHALNACHSLLAANDLRVRRLPELLGATVVTAPEGSLVNINTPDDLERWQSNVKSDPHRCE